MWSYNSLYQAPKHVVVPYVENTLYSTNKYSCVRRVHIPYINYFIEHNRDDEPRDNVSKFKFLILPQHVSIQNLRPKFCV